MPSTRPDPHDFHLPAVARLTAQQEQDLARRRATGDPDEALAARDALVLANLGLAFDKANRFRNGRYRRHADDLRSLSICGLIEAAERYRPVIASSGKPVRFSTYAVHWMRSYLEPSPAEDFATIRVPRVTVQAMGHAREHAATGRPIPPRYDTPGFRESVAHGEAACGLQATGRAGLDRDDLREIPGRPDAGEEMDGTAGDVAPVRPELARALRRLKNDEPDQYRVVMLVHPTDGGPSLTIAEAAMECGRSKEWARRACELGLRRLKGYLMAEGYRGSCDRRDGSEVAA